MGLMREGEPWGGRKAKWGVENRGGTRGGQAGSVCGDQDRPGCEVTAEQRWEERK